MDIYNQGTGLFANFKFNHLFYKNHPLKYET